MERRRKSSALVAFAGETYRKSRTLAPSSSACVPNSLAKVFFIPLSLSSSLDKLFLGPISFPRVSANSGLQTDFCWVLGCGDDNGSGCWSAATFERLSLFWGFFPIPITFRRSSTATFTMSSIDFWSTNGFLNRASIRSNFLESLSRVLAMAIRLALFPESLLPSSSLEPFPVAAASPSLVLTLFCFLVGGSAFFFFSLPFPSAFPCTSQKPFTNLPACMSVIKLTSCGSSG